MGKFPVGESGTFRTVHHTFLSMRALLIAPAILPFVLSALFTMAPGGNKLLAFIFFFGVGCVISYGATVVVAMPCLWLMSLFTRPNLVKTALLGLVLGIWTCQPIIYIMWQGSGPDSGPPETRFIDFLWDWFDDWLSVVIALSGLFTSVAYWLLAAPVIRRRSAAGRPDTA